jgi:hypothetical protein
MKHKTNDLSNLVTDNQSYTSHPLTKPHESIVMLTPNFKQLERLRKF